MGNRIDTQDPVAVNYDQANFRETIKTLLA